MVIFKLELKGESTFCKKQGIFSFEIVDDWILKFFKSGNREWKFVGASLDALDKFILNFRFSEVGKEKQFSKFGENEGSFEKQRGCFLFRWGF